MRVVLLVIALVLPAPALAQEAPPALYAPAPAQDAGTAHTTDGGRSELLLGLALVCAVGAGALGVLALRRGRPSQPEPVPVREPWRPRVKSDLPPLPAFRSGPEPPAT